MNAFKMKTVSHLQVAFQIVKLSVLDKNVRGTEAVSTRFPQSLLSQFREYKNDAKTGKISSLKVEHFDNGMQLEKKFKHHGCILILFRPKFSIF